MFRKFLILLASLALLALGGCAQQPDGDNTTSAEPTAADATVSDQPTSQPSQESTEDAADQESTGQVAASAACGATVLPDYLSWDESQQAWTGEGNTVRIDCFSAHSGGEAKGTRIGDYKRDWKGDGRIGEVSVTEDGYRFDATLPSGEALNEAGWVKSGQAAALVWIGPADISDFESAVTNFNMS